MVTPKLFTVGIVFALLNLGFSFNLMFNGRPGEQAVDFLQAGSDKRRNAAPAAASFATSSSNEINKRPHDHHWDAYEKGHRSDRKENCLEGHSIDRRYFAAFASPAASPSVT